MIADRHLHTEFSEDSNEDPKRAIEKAISLGMKDIYITDHYDMDFPDGHFMFDTGRYFDELEILKESYADRIAVHAGVELGLKPEIGGRLLEFIEKNPFEYTIGSVHLIDDKDPYYRNEFDMSDRDFYRRYFEEVLLCLDKCSGFDTLGHLDYVVRYGYKKDKEYSYEDNADLIDEILKRIIASAVALEINTAGLRKGLGFAHPYPQILKRYRELGGAKLAMGSDAHSAEDIGSKFDETMDYLKKFSFGYANFI